MQESQKVPYTKDDVLNHRKMAQRYGLDPEQTYALMTYMYKRNMHTKAANNTVPVIIPLKTSHRSKNDPDKKPLRVHPAAHNYFLAEYFKLYPNEKPAPESAVKETGKSTADKMNTATKRLSQKQIDKASAATKAYLAQKKNKVK